MPVRRWLSALAACAALSGLQAAADFSGASDVLDAPATRSALARFTLYNGLTLAGRRVVAVGQRGHILYSDDRGANWTQAAAAVSSDLVAVDFPTPDLGWAVGHDGVILHSTDAGATWSRQLDGRGVGGLLLEYYTAAAAAGSIRPPETAARLVEEARLLAAQGPQNPFLDVWFEDERNGFVVGAYNLILRTADGGRSWEPWLHRVPNPRALHLYTIARVADAVYLCGEQGLLLKLDAREQRFHALEIPYDGTLFGVTGGAAGVVAFGLRGNAFHSADSGVSWRKIDTGLEVGLTGGAAEDGLVALVSQAGHLLLSHDGGLSFALQPLERPLPAAAVLPLGHDTFVVGGPRGVTALTLSRVE